MSPLGEEEVGRAVCGLGTLSNMAFDRPGNYAVDVRVEKIIRRWDVAAVDGKVFDNGCMRGRSFWKTTLASAWPWWSPTSGRYRFSSIVELPTESSGSEPGSGLTACSFPRPTPTRGQGISSPPTDTTSTRDVFLGLTPVVTDFLIDGIAGAIEDAAFDLQPAEAGWIFEPVWDFTYNRSFEAYERNTSFPLRTAARRARRENRDR